MVIGNRCGNIRAPDAVEVLFLKHRSSFRAGLLANLEKGYRQFFFAPVAQLDRAPGYEPGGRGFESLRAHQFGVSRTCREWSLNMLSDRALAPNPQLQDSWRDLKRFFEPSSAQPLPALPRLLPARELTQPPTT
jgi:hypothetical protein